MLDVNGFKGADCCSHAESALDLSMPKKSCPGVGESPVCLREDHCHRASETSKTSTEGSISPEFERRRLLTPPKKEVVHYNTAISDVDSDVNDVDVFNPPPVFPDAAPFEQTGEAPIYQTSGGVTIYLHDETMWREFAKYGTEMIINRGGRRMFPHIVLSMFGLNPEVMYSVILEIVPADERRYKFINNQWVAMGMADPGPDVQPVLHTDSPNMGDYWMRNRTSFSKVRLTNNKDTSAKECLDGNILLLSMHKYKVVIRIRPEVTSHSEPERVFVFDESAFIAVTAYQNSQITQLKIQNNPFAKAFRDAHNPSVIQATPAKKRERNGRHKESGNQHHSRSTSMPQNPVSTRGWPLPPQFPAPVGHPAMLNMAMFEHMCRNMDTAGAHGAMPYFPWAALSRQFSAPVFSKAGQMPLPVYPGPHFAGLPSDLSHMRLPLTSPSHSGSSELSSTVTPDKRLTVSPPLS
ncbi:T-box transcription factor TBX19-like [Mya arenaria]|uniref:T-box transcription factor TBX19-like n=1 Tax=Mya arenaria TaxID=6604 RepID=UPI0022E92B5C|nr:T-box transcription factor TBX19-like [Mya arenaria]